MTIHLPKAFDTATRAVGLALALCLAGCAGISTLDNDVASYGEWPAARAPGTYAFERLPSQKTSEKRQAALEQIARHALETAGFKPAVGNARPDVTVQIGVRVTMTDESPWDDPFWWRWPGRGAYFAGHGLWRPWALNEAPRYDREVAVLVRDGASGQPLYEAHASSTGGLQANDRLLGAMFDAALADFPRTDAHVHTVRTPLAPR